MGSPCLGSCEKRQLRFSLTELQTLLFQRLRVRQPLCLPDLQQFQLLLPLLQLAGEQITLHLRQSDIEIAVNHVCHQRHSGTMQLCGSIQHTGRTGAFGRLRIAKQTQIPAHINAGVEISIAGSDILKCARTCTNHGQEGRTSGFCQQFLLTQAQHGLRDIQILGQRLIHQRIERMVIPGLPPLCEFSIAGANWARLLPFLGQRGVQPNVNRRSAPRQQ